ncbi:hypothetical protein [Haliscomenobacter sp.]|uniref:hypothetical protein n=1 Tax=Haliscomenobacter sp. TaxID=2717303 RepID=UPI003364F9FB
MRHLKSWLLALCGLALLNTSALAYHTGKNNPKRPTPAKPELRYLEDCNNAVAQIDQAINNVRARLTTGGDVWWDSNDGRYVVPKVAPGLPEVSSIFAGAVWLGGVDPAGNLKLAAQTYGRSERQFDFFPGPLNSNGKTNKETCSKWDRFFVVKGESIREHLRNWNAAVKAGKSYNPDQIPRDIKGWPASGNEFFEEIHGFSLPSTRQGLAGFWDQDGDGNYNPDLGDFPVIEVRGCLDKPQFPDEMIFWVYNDAGNIHAESKGDPIQMEVQVQAFSYATNDEINDMTFQRYKLINRAVESIDSTYFAMWVDPDLGCFTDDYVGCDTSRSLAFIYNEDALDGTTGCTCNGAVNTYCDEIPLLGIDYFRGPLDENGEEIGMSSFTYYNNQAVGSPSPGTTDPSNAQEYYNYLSGSWRDGTPFTFGDDAYQDGAAIKYAFTDTPNNTRGWTMCSADIPFGDRRTIQASGPFRLDPGALNELIVGAVWVADQQYPCPDISKLLEADDIAQALFDNCFELTDGPDAPDVDFIEMDKEIIAVFTNDTITSNNAREAYAQRGLQVPAGVADSLFRFEGYKLYQLAGSDVSVSSLENPDKARLIYQVDVKNGVGRVFNWRSVDNPTGSDFYTPELKVEGGDRGIQHTFRITEDQFASGDRRLVNHKKYYFLAVAYAYNNYRAFDPKLILGQRRPYLEGRRNIGDGFNPFYTVVPRPITDRNLNAAYGEGAVITRLAGAGTGNNFLDINTDTRNAIIQGTFAQKPEITYRAGRGPIGVKIFNPLEVKNGEFELRIVDNDLNNDRFDPPVRWELRNLSVANSRVIRSEKSIDDLNEQIVKEYGFSISIGQTNEPGTDKDSQNGKIGYEEEYLRSGATPWMFGIKDEYSGGVTEFDSKVFDFVATGDGEPDQLLDPKEALTNIGPGYFVPYFITNFRNKDNQSTPYITPAWSDLSGGSFLRTQTKLADVNNVDIVFTSNKSLWSRCVVVESANRFYPLQGFETERAAGETTIRRHFDLRGGANVTKDDANNDGRPDPETNPDPALSRVGFGWFPGYAIDVETGQRLNVFFGENSVYGGTNDPLINVGRDMMFNPNNLVKIGNSTTGNLGPYFAGGQHFVYVMRTAYDSCKVMSRQLRPNNSPINKGRVLKDISWAGLILPRPGVNFKSYKDGLIPEDVVVKLRVTNPYQVDRRTGVTGFKEKGYPVYRFRIDGKQAEDLSRRGVDSALALIKITPNPYYGFSDYEVSQFTTTVKITNLPAKCVITIYSLDGKFIRQYRRDEVGQAPRGNNRAIPQQQITPDLEWDLKNNKNIPISSGVYLIHVDAGELGQRTIKWFGVNRKFDPSGL